MKRKLLASTVTALITSVAFAWAPAAAQAPQPQQKPNILFIMGDDIGIMQPGCYHQGLMVGETPNIDRIASEGGRFMDYYAIRVARRAAARFSPGCTRSASA